MRALVFVLLLSGIASAQDATTGAIQGIVRDRATGEAMIGATVVVTAPGGAQQVAITDEQGAYDVTGLVPGHDELVIGSWPETGEIYGEVIPSWTGKPVAGATVEIAGPGITPRTTTTDERGVFNFESLPPGGPYAVVAHYDGVSAAQCHVDVLANTWNAVWEQLDAASPDHWCGHVDTHSTNLGLVWP